MPVMMASADQRACLGVHLASWDVLGPDRHGGGDGGGDDIARHRLYAIHRSTRARSPNLRSLDLTWSLREARSPYLHYLPHQPGPVQKTWSGCKGHPDLDIADTLPLVYPNACLWSRQRTVVKHFSGHDWPRCHR